MNNLAGSGKPIYLSADFPNDSLLKHAILPGVVNGSFQPQEWERQITAKERNNP